MRGRLGIFMHHHLSFYSTSYPLIDNINIDIKDNGHGSSSEVICKDNGMPEIQGIISGCRADGLCFVRLKIAERQDSLVRHSSCNYVEVESR